MNVLSLFDNSVFIFLMQKYSKAGSANYRLSSRIYLLYIMMGMQRKQNVALLLDKQAFIASWETTTTKKKPDFFIEQPQLSS